MKTISTFALLGALATSPLVHAADATQADLAEGKALHTKYCINCHEQRFGGEEGSAIYLRPKHKVRSLSALSQQVTTCTTMLHLQLFPEDEAKIVAYLNAAYYKFH